MATKPRRVTRRELLKWASIGAASASLGVLVGDTTDQLQVEQRELRLPKWDADGFRVVVISDFHANSEHKRNRSLLSVQLALQQKADVILMPGDFLNGVQPERLGYLRSILDAVGQSPCPVFATLGNHDYATSRPQSIIETIRASRVKLLQNEVQECQGVSIAGIDDALAKMHRPQILTEGSFSKSLLTMLHEPDFVRVMPDRVSLMIAGHSHGGQVCLPMGIPIHTPLGAKRYIEGFYEKSQVPLFVSRGVGTSGTEFRYFCPPQVAVLTLRGA